MDVCLEGASFACLVVSVCSVCMCCSSDARKSSRCRMFSFFVGGRVRKFSKLCSVRCVPLLINVFDFGTGAVVCGVFW